MPKVHNGSNLHTSLSLSGGTDPSFTSPLAHLSVVSGSTGRERKMREGPSECHQETLSPAHVEQAQGSLR